MENKKLNILVLSGGPSPEHEVSLKTGQVIAAALDKNKYNVEILVLPKNGDISGLNFLYKEKEIPHPTSPLEYQEGGRTLPDAVFIAMHGKFGEDGTIQGFLELAGVPYIGSGVLASALAMDKLKSAELFSFHSLGVPKYFGFSKKEMNGIKEKIKNSFSLPFVVKPRSCGSSVGITIIKKFEDFERAALLAFDYDDFALAQEYISGTEVTCAILDEGNGAPIALPPTQIIPKAAEFFDYEAKYTAGATEEITPPRLPEEIIKKIQDNALLAHKILGCAGLSRTDMIVRGNDIFVLETNTIPGMTETSLYPQAAAAVGISFPELLNKIIQAAQKI